MKHIMMIALVAGLLSFTGCAGHRAAQNCNSCNSGQCGNDCNSGHCQGCGHGHGGGLLGLGLLGGGHHGVCKGCQGGVPVGCRPGPLHWQQGGLNYSEGLSYGLLHKGGQGNLDYAGGVSPGFLGHGAGQAMQAQPVNPGPPTGTVGYPYYTHRGPRDFLLDNPPSIGR